MARAAAKRKPPRVITTTAYRKKHKDSAGQRYEDTLFFNRLRTHAKWVFVLLIIAFGLGFVLFGVGSSNLGGLSDIFNGIRGGGGTPSIDKPLKGTQQNPKDAQAWNDLATAYDAEGRLRLRDPGLGDVRQLRPKDADGLTRLATDYEQQFSAQTNDAVLAQTDAQNAQPTNLGPPSTSPLGRALGSTPDPIEATVSQAANTRFSTALSARQADVDAARRRLPEARQAPAGRAGHQFQLARRPRTPATTAVAIAAYKRVPEARAGRPERRRRRRPG